MSPRVALIHDWLTGMRGGERVLEMFLSLYPEADIFTLIHIPGSTSGLIDSRVRQASFLSGLPSVKKWYRACLPLYPRAIAGFDLRGYDLVISLSHAAAKNVTVPKGIPHICYCFTPMRYIWDQCREYFGMFTPALWPVLRGLRHWDTKGAQGVSNFVAISRFVQARVRCFYRRPADVVYPAVSVDWIPFNAGSRQNRPFLYAGALVPYKRPEVVVQACTRLGLPLWVVGRGPMLSDLKRIAGPTVRFFGHVSDRELGELYGACRAFVYPGVEDFGLTPVECMAAGTPVIANDNGGLRETVKGIRPWNSEDSQPDSPSGMFFRLQPGHNLAQQVEYSLKSFMEQEGRISPDACRRRALEFSPQRFVRDWTAVATREGLPGATGRNSGGSGLEENLPAEASNA